MNCCVLLPAYNEEIAIAQVVADIRDRGYQVVVIDDGSCDRTAHLAEQAGAKVVRHAQNKGKGQALRTGFAHALAQGYDAVIIMDADGQHSPDEIAAFVDRARQSTAGIIVGNRMHKPKGMPWLRWATNHVTSAIISGIIKSRVSDTQCGFRLVKRQVLEQITLTTDRFDTESEMLFEASRRGFAIESVPIRTIYADEKSKIHPWRDTLRFWRLIIDFLLRKDRRGL